MLVELRNKELFGSDSAGRLKGSSRSEDGRGSQGWPEASVSRHPSLFNRSIHFQFPLPSSPR